MTLISDFQTSTVSKIVLVTLGGSAVLWVGLMLVGFATGEWLGYVAFGTLVSSVGVMLATAVSLKAPSATFQITRVVWIAVAVLILLLGMLAGISDLVAYPMVALAFPLGFVALPLIGAAIGVSETSSGMVIIWLVCVVGGYLQWFVLLPRLFRRSQPYPT